MVGLAVDNAIPVSLGSDAVIGIQTSSGQVGANFLKIM